MDKKITLYLKAACFTVLMGRAYQFLFWDAPFRSLLWDQKLIESIVNLFGYEWSYYANSLTIDSHINWSIKLNGGFFLIAGFLLINLHKNSKKWITNTVLLSGVSLLILAILQTKEKFYHFAMFFEHAIQFSLPFLLIYFLSNKNIKTLSYYLKVVIALAFTCHGLYATGVLYPLPANFVTMTMNILPVTENHAKLLLLVAGILDFIIAVFIFIPKLVKPTLLYAAFWGCTTALARIISGFTYDISLSITHQYLYLTLFRLSHGIIPLLLFYILKDLSIKSFEKKTN